MRLFDVDWLDVMRNLSRWSALSVSERASLLHVLKLSGYTSATLFGTHLQAVVDSGIATYDTERHRLLLAEPHRELLKVLRAMGRHPLFDDPTDVALRRYMEEHFTQDEANVVGGKRAQYAFPNVSRQDLVTLASSAGWPGDLLDAASDEELVAWAVKRGEQADDPRLPDTVRRLRWIVEALVAADNTASIADWYGATEESEREAFARAVHLGLRTIVLFAAMSAHDLEPLIGVWPAAAQEMRRGPAHAPVAVTPTAQFGAAVLMEDMTALLASIVAAPVRLRTNDLKVFARAAAEIESRLIFVPPWSEPWLMDAYDTRMDRVTWYIRWHKYATIQSVHGNPHLVSTAEGEAWLALSAHDRLHSLLDPMRASKSRNPSYGYGTRDVTDFFAFTLPFMHEPEQLNLRHALESLFLDLGDGFFPVDKFLDFASRSANPFLQLPQEEMQRVHRQMYLGTTDTRDAFRALWHNAVLEFLQARLAVYGGVTLGVQDDGTVCFSLTDIGRYLLGASDGFRYGSANASDIVVQPNFDIVFLSASPSVEALLSRAAERIGEAPGLTFRLTRASVVRAAESGLTGDEVLAMLTMASSKPVPQNVEREVRGWMAAIRRAQLRTIHVVETGDEQTAARVLSLLGDKAKQLTSTMVELSASTPSARAAMIRKWKAGGVLLEDLTGRSQAPSRGRRATQYE